MMTCDLRESAEYCLGVRSSSILFTIEYILTWLFVLQIMARPRGSGSRRGAGSNRGVGHPCRVPVEPEVLNRFQRLEDQFVVLAGLVQQLVQQ